MATGHRLNKMAKDYGLTVRRYKDQNNGRRYGLVSVHLAEDVDGVYPITSQNRTAFSGYASELITSCTEQVMADLEHMERYQTLMGRIEDARDKLAGLRIRQGVEAR